MSVRISVESLSGCAWNGCPSQRGIRNLRAELVPEDVEWRPAPLPRPRIDGPQIATVVGPAGEEIHCD
ncbi:hypothetical protein JTM61_37865, partial [Pseudomonas aeruginosa]|nr:hypothetical protein [Pseudomonas aeruginosa]